jgi:hypothetical protein
MTLGQLFRSPFVRVPFLAFAVFSSVATSAPSWSLEDATPKERIELQAGQSVERKVAYDASEDHVRLRVVLERFSSTSGATLRITGEECHLSGLYEQRPGGEWFNLDASTTDEIPSSPSLSLDGSCKSLKSGTLVLRIENVGATGVAFDAHQVASIGYDGTDETPSGAFVHVTVLP